MYRLSFTIVLLLAMTPLLAQSPHGNDLKIDCGQCHNPNGWEIDYATLQFDHNTTNFELEGSHSTTDCKACHTDLTFKNTTTDCMSCHLDVHSQSVGNDCMRCHNSESWLVFNIPELHEQNGFPLIGAHTNLSCIECHSNESSLIFNPIGNECIECHRDDYMATTNPNHPLSGFSTDCLECHSPLSMGWDSGGINHDFFPLTQGHDIQDCSRCHDVTNFSNISDDCFSCHMDDYAQTTNPNHQAANFSTDCNECHTTAPGWMPAILNHDFFPLTMGHDIQDCNECHINGNFNNTPTDCFACHSDDYNATSDPDHQAANFPTDCVLCHTTSPGWMPATVNHGFFPLTLGHDIQDCNECHINGNFTNTPTDCFACHADDYNATTNPDHQAANFPTDCASCHSTNPGWMPAVLNHDFFPLTLGHDIQECASCHINGNYTTTPTDCFACHMDDYNATTNPNHSAAQFPTDCVTCHTTNPGWMPATFDHDSMYFPIYSGQHEGEWNQCIDCHINTSNYAVFTCVTCHTQIDMDDEHEGVSGYVYQSNACFACHPNP
ncbi:hypothetical protein [Pukyongia salina]|nr:hypothetical protein [Pukyongia salina]